MISEEYYDQTSRDEYLYQVRWNIDAETKSQPYHDGISYFPDFIRPIPDEHFLDCGAFDGDTLVQFIKLNHDFGQPDCRKHYTAIEPDVHSYALLTDNLRILGPAIQEHVTLIQAAVCFRNRSVPFNHTGTCISRLEPSSPGFAQAVSIDFLLPHLKRPPTFIKMDVEGSELNALFGAIKTIQQHQPALAICTYHQIDHLWNIPVLLRTLCPNHFLLLRRYGPDIGESVCYAVPPDRLVEDRVSNNGEETR